jgi:hypothetical protein
LKIHILKRFSAYLIERTYPLISLPLVIGYSVSAALITKGYVELFPFVITSLLIFCIMSYFRLKNDIDDFEKDQIAFAERSLPRGMISKRDAQEVMQYLEYILASFLGIILIFYPAKTKALLLLVGGYLWLMKYKFYLPSWKKRSPLLKKFLNHVFFIPLTLLVMAIWSSPQVFSLPSLSYTLIVFSTIFVSNLCRKLDPYAHPASLTFIHYYGFHFSYYIALTALLLSALGAYELGVGLWLWPCELSVLYFLSRLFKKPKQFHIVQIASIFSLFMHIWAGIFYNRL